MKKILIAFIILLGMVQSALAQPLFGNTGIGNIPTADMQKAGTFVGGATFLPDSYLSKSFHYNTGMYYINFTPFSWCELTFRETLQKTHKRDYYGIDNGKYGFYQQDRSYTLRLRPLHEVQSKWWPSVVLAVNDPWSDNGGSYYSCVYGVVTKHVGVNGIGDFGVSVGYAYPMHEGDGFGRTKAYDGVFGGVGFTPAFWDQMVFSADYDTQSVNLALNVRLFRHWNIYAFERDFEKVGFGMSYQYTIDF